MAAGAQGIISRQPVPPAGLRLHPQRQRSYPNETTVKFLLNKPSLPRPSPWAALLETPPPELRELCLRLEAETVS